jgi:hypothetical protein
MRSIDWFIAATPAEGVYRVSEGGRGHGDRGPEGRKRKGQVQRSRDRDGAARSIVRRRFRFRMRFRFGLEVELVGVVEGGTGLTQDGR